MLKRSTIALVMVLVIGIAFGISAQDKMAATKYQMNFSAASPQAEKGVIAANQNFTVDLILDYKGAKEMTGGTFGVSFYSPDNSIKKVSHVPVDTTAKLFKSIQYLNGWDNAFKILNMINLDSLRGFDGNLPDTTYFIFAGLEGIPSMEQALPMIRYNLKVEGSGKLCIDSVGQATKDLDWLFPDYFEVSFGGPYCWEIK